MLTYRHSLSCLLQVSQSSQILKIPVSWCFSHVYFTLSSTAKCYDQLTSQKPHVHCTNLCTVYMYLVAIAEFFSDDSAMHYILLVLWTISHVVILEWQKDSVDVFFSSKIVAWTDGCMYASQCSLPVMLMHVQSILAQNTLVNND